MERFCAIPSSSLWTLACTHMPTRALISSVVQPEDILVCRCKASARHAIDSRDASLFSMGMLRVQSHDQSTSRGQSTLNWIQTTSRSGLSQTGFKPLWLNAHSRLDSVNANQCALNRIECALSVQCERALNKKYMLILLTDNAHNTSEAAHILGPVYRPYST